MEGASALLGASTRPHTVQGTLTDGPASKGDQGNQTRTCVSLLLPVGLSSHMYITWHIPCPELPDWGGQLTPGGSSKPLREDDAGNRQSQRWEPPCELQAVVRGPRTPLLITQRLLPHPGLWEGSSSDFGAPWWLRTKTSPIPPKHSLRAPGTEQAVYYVALSILSVQAVLILQETSHVALWHLEKLVLPAPGFGFLWCRESW